MKEPTVEYRFNRDCRIELGFGQQVDVQQGKTFTIPYELAKKLNASDIDYGQIASNEVVLDTEEKNVTQTTNESTTVELFTKYELDNLNMSKLRNIGDVYEVKDNKKDELVEKVLRSQVYTENFLNELDIEDLEDLTEVLDLETKQAEDCEDLINIILDFQND